MSRDHRKLHVFHVADELVLALYALTGNMPLAERFGLQSQLRRAAVSIPTNIVEGCGRESEPEYARFLQISLSSARETIYLLGLSTRLGFLPADKAPALTARYDQLAGGLSALIKARTSRRHAR